MSQNVESSGVRVEQSGVNYITKWSRVESSGASQYKSYNEVELSCVSEKIE